jgi:predicted neutral ceramidase superfamily lipid hydrolase
VRRSNFPWLMIAVMVAVTLWSCVDGEQSPAMMAVAAVGTVAAMMVLGLLESALPRTRLMNAVFAGAWVLLFMPAWDWLEHAFSFPGSFLVALVYAAALGLFRYATSPRGPARPPS